MFSAIVFAVWPLPILFIALSKREARSLQPSSESKVFVGNSCKSDELREAVPREGQTSLFIMKMPVVEPRMNLAMAM